MKHLNLDPATVVLHYDRLNSQLPFGSLFQQQHNSVATEYAKTADLEDVYQGRARSFGYGRQGNASVEALEKRLTALEGGTETVAFASGMAAYDGAFSTLLRAGDHVIASKHIFSNTVSLLNTYQDRWGVEVTYVDTTNVENVKRSTRGNTKLVVLETIANPGVQVADLSTIGTWCTDQSIVYLVDNTVTTPVFFKPRDIGASLVLHSLTKSISGHGRVLGGSVTDTGLYDWLGGRCKVDEEFRTHGSDSYHRQLRKRGRSNKGSMLTAAEATLISMGMETLPLRVEKSSQNAIALADLLSKHPKVSSVYFPGLTTHNNHELASQLFTGYGALLSFDLNNLSPQAFLDKLSLIVVSSSLGDTRTLAIPPASTIFHDLGKESRTSMGISETMIRLSVGIESISDLCGDISQALGSF